MRTLQSLVLVSLLFVAVLPLAGQTASSQSSHSPDLKAGDLRVKVVDPESALVPGAEIVLLREGGGAPVSVQPASASGQVSFRGLEAGKYSIYVLAAGFGVKEQSVTVPAAEEVTVQLAIVSAVETVTVTAAGVPVPAEDSGAQVSALDASQLDGMQPVAAADALRFLPGAVVSTFGRRGGLSSLSVRGGESRYNKVIVDGVPVNDPGGYFDFGVESLGGADRVEVARGAQSTLYGSEAMTSVVQIFTREGTTHAPEILFGADGGTFGTARGYASLAGARGLFDYHVFGAQTNTNGQGINDVYSSSSEGANVGVALSQRVQFRLRTRHASSFSGVPGEWFSNSTPPIPPDSEQRARTNTFLASTDLSIGGFARWHHDLQGYEYHLNRRNVDSFADPGRQTVDFQFDSRSNINRAGFRYQGEYWARSWARTTFGYEFEDEKGFIGDPSSPPIANGLRRNHGIYGQEILTLGRLALVAGARFVHNRTLAHSTSQPVDDTYNKLVPRVAANYLLWRGGEVLSGTRLRFAYATGIQAPALDQIVPTAFTRGNSDLKAEENRSLEAGVQQEFSSGKYSVVVNFFENNFRRQIEFCCFDPSTGLSQYINLNRSIARGAEFEAHARLKRRLSLDGAYTNLSTRILDSGGPLFRRPKHSGSLLLNYAASRWGGDLGGSFVGRRTDSDFFALPAPINHAPGYARVDVGGWYKIHSRVTAYVNVENALNHHYEEVVGYPALRANFRAGLRFRLGGE